MNLMKYEGYLGKVAHDESVGHFHGQVINSRDTITFAGDSVAELRQALKDSVEDYLAFCKEEGVEPNKPFSGSLSLRIPPELHRDLVATAASQGKSANAFIAEALKTAVSRHDSALSQ